MAGAASFDPPLPFSPAAECNGGPILLALSGILAPRAQVLEVASGSGQHAARFAAAQPGWRWQPTEFDSAALAAIDARCAGLTNVAPTQVLDVLTGPWPSPAGRFDAVVCVNLLHISPWSCCEALMHGAAGALGNGGALVLYGPYRVDGEPTTPGNLAFDADLRARDARRGLRRLDEVVETAARSGLRFAQRIRMPANNLLLVWQRPSAPG